MGDHGEKSISIIKMNMRYLYTVWFKDLNVTGKSDRNQSVMATFNFFDPNTQPVEHKKADVDPYLKWGN